MPRRRSIPLLALLAAAAAPAAAQIDGEHLAAPADPALLPGVVRQSRGAFMSESVPRDESLEAWNRMVTIERFPWRPGMSPEAVTERLGAAFASVCSNTTVMPVRVSMVAGRQAADMRVDCLLNPQTGKPETMIGRAILGDEALHMIQVAFRHVPTPAENAWAEKTIAGSLLCARASTDARCR